MRISGKYTSEQWKTLSAKLERNPSESLWDSAYLHFYRTRIDTRYLYPMTSIQKAAKESGEGFAMVALFCTLIEFLESCERGDNFHYIGRTKENLLPNEYDERQASDYFKNFLKIRKPFAALFPPVLIPSFYQNVRCGLLHEAQTKGGWIISAAASGGALISVKGSHITLFRNQLVPALEEYLTDYRMRLLADSPGTREAFLRKFDYLSKDQLNHILL